MERLQVLLSRLIETYAHNMTEPAKVAHNFVAAATAAAMDTGSDVKGDSIGATIRTTPSSPETFEFKLPVAAFPPIAVNAGILQHKARLLALQKRNESLDKEVARLATEQKAMSAEHLISIMTDFAEYHLLPWVSTDDQMWPILVNPTLDKVWALQTEQPSFASSLPVALWDQAWQLRWKQLGNFKQCLRVRYSGSARDMMCECNSLAEAASYSQQLVASQAEKLLPKHIRLNSNNCCVYEINNEHLIVFRDVSAPVEKMRFFCMTVGDLTERVRKLEQKYDQGYTSDALQSFAKHSRPSEFADNALLHRHVVSALTVHVAVRLESIKMPPTQLSPPTHPVDPFRNLILQLAPSTAGHHWEKATEKLLIKLGAVAAQSNETTRLLAVATVRFWFSALTQYVVKPKIYQYCKFLYTKFSGKETISAVRLARWMSGVCNVLITEAHTCEDPALFTWSSNAYIVLPRV